MASRIREKRPLRRHFKRQLDTEDTDFLDMLLTEVNEEEAAEVLGEIEQFGDEDREERAPR
ncbi:MAG: hypothetical protein GX795_05955 [Firmicutes bacterium]|jgi:hypothetical protein|nr:hypothetical protein [Bacillota bacterium]